MIQLVRSDAVREENTAVHPSIRDITLAVEFLTTALRALADGHEAESHMVRDPLLWGFSKVRDLADPYLKKVA